MGKRMRLALLLVLLTLLTGCMRGAAPPANPAAFDSEAIPASLAPVQPQAGEDQSDRHTVSLYFRFQGEDLLAREARSITLPYDQRLERVLIEMLIEGPSANMLELSGLFVPGTRLVSLQEQESLLFVTLSQDFLSTPPDLPLNWRDDPALKQEVLTRRRLAMDSIVNTLTECTGYTAVQLLIQQNLREERGQRIQRTEIYGSERDPNQLFGPVTRSESMLLTHYNAANIILSCWQQKDWERLYRFVWHDGSRPTADAFEQEMDGRVGALLSFSLSPGTVSSDGSKAIFSVQLGLYARDGSRQLITSMPMQLDLERDNWKIRYDMLLRLMQAAG